MTTERRAADRRISPAIATFAITQYARLRQELAEARALAIEANGGMLAAVGESMRLRQEVEQWHKESILNMHKVITCGVAATHPDANLTNTGAYKQWWDSPQAESVRKLRDALTVSEALLADCRDSLTSAREESDRLRAAQQWQQEPVAWILGAKLYFTGPDFKTHYPEAIPVYGDPPQDGAREECAMLRAVIAELVEALSLAYSFSKYSAAIHCFERRTPTQEWFDEHAKLIEDLQQKLEAAIAKGAA